MKISELILKLKKAQSEYGDLPVKTFGGGSQAQETKEVHAAATQEKPEEVVSIWIV